MVATAALFAGAGAPAANAAPKPPKLGAGEPGDVAESIATKITDPSFTRLIFNLIKDEETGPTIGDVMRELATINRKLDVLDRSSTRSPRRWRRSVPTSIGSSCRST